MESSNGCVELKFPPLIWERMKMVVMPILLDAVLLSLAIVTKGVF